jgi:hypothetical protein
MQMPAAGGDGGVNHAYRLCGLKLESDFDLPALPGWDGPADAPADVSCRLGKVPTQLDRPDYVAPLFQTRGAGEYLLALPGTGRILICEGHEITVEPEAGASNLSAILTGPIQAVLWHQRGLLPLHASVVVMGGRAVALCGCGAAGKSTLAAMVAARGYGVIADDIGVVDAHGGSEVLVQPACASLQLWPDALAELGVAPAGLRRPMGDKAKYFLDCGSIASAPQKLAAVVLVRRHQTLPPATIERLHGAQAGSALFDCVHTRRPADALGCGEAIFASFLRMAAAGVSFWRLGVPEGLAGLRQATAKLLAALED